LKALKNKVIAITKGRDDSGSVFDELVNYGAEVVFIPTISVEAIESTPLFDSAIKTIEAFQYLVFTSSATVRFFYQKISRLKVNIDYSKLIVACVGLKTADECKKYAIPVNFVPQASNALSLAQELIKEDINGKNVLVPCSDIARGELAEVLRNNGALVSSIPIYETKMPSDEDVSKLKKSFSAQKVDLIAFTSPSSFCNFLMMFHITSPKDFFEDYKVAAIGNTTKNAIAGSAVKVDIVPAETSLPGLINSIIEYYSK